MRKKVLLIHRYFWPDTPPYATMLRYIAGTLARKHEVTVLSSQPSYKSDVAIEEQNTREIMDGFMVRRLKVPKVNRAKIISRLWATWVYLCKVFFYIIKHRPDVVMVSTAPAVLSGFTVQWAARIAGSKFYYHCQDIHPEIAYLSGQIKFGLLYKLLRKMDSMSCNAADKVIVISNDMRSSLVKRCVTEKKIHVISNFALESGLEGDLEKDVSPINLGENCFNILFAGNIGRFQSLGSVLDLAAEFRHNNQIHFYFMGTGVYLNEMKRRVKGEGLKNVFFIPHQPIAIARALMQQAKLCIVSLNKDIYKYAYPSKTLTYLAEGRPLLCIIERESELAKIVETNRLGITCGQDNVHELKSAIHNLITNHEMYLEYCQNVEHYFSKNLLIDQILADWDKIFMSRVI